MQIQKSIAKNGDDTVNQISVQNLKNCLVPSECAVEHEAFCTNKQNKLHLIYNTNTTVILEQKVKQNTSKHFAICSFRRLLKSQPYAANVDAHSAEEINNGITVQIYAS